MEFKYKKVTENKIDFKNKEDLLANIGFPITNKQEILKYLQNGSPAVTTWLQKDVLRGEDSIQGYALPAYDDGEYEWTELEIFYFKKYDLKLSDEFIRKAGNL